MQGQGHKSERGASGKRAIEKICMATGGRRDDPSSPSSSNYSSSSSGIKPWGLLVLFCIFVLLFLPSFLSSSFRGFRPAAIKSGWDTLNFILVVFAILCGVLGRRKEESDRSPTASSPKNWFSDHAAQSGYLDRSGPGHASGFRRMRSSSSYPDLRHEPEWGGANGWRCYDDTQLYRRRPESRGWESQSFGEWEDKTIPVGSVRQRSPSPKSRPPLPPSPSPPLPPRVLSPPPPTSQPLATRSMHKLPNDMLENGMSDTDKYQLPSPPPEPQPRQGHRRGKSLEKVPEMIERDASTRMRHRRSRTVEDLPNSELEQAWNLGVQNAQMPHWASPPPPPPPPSHSKTNYKKRSGGGPKDIAAAITSFYQKKKKGKRSGRSYEDLSVYFDPSSSSAPPRPPPPPPPSNSVFHHLFSHKKIKKRRNQSPPSAVPPPPPPPPPLRASTRPSKMMSSDPHSAPAPPPTHRSKRQAPVPRPSPPPPEAFPHKEEKPDIYDLPIAPPSPLLPPPPPPPPLRASSQPSKMSSDSHSSPAPPPTHRSKRQAAVPRPSPPPPGAFPLKEEKPDIYDLPVTPPSPLLPPPPPPPPPVSDSQELLSDNEVINMERKSFKGTTTGESVALFCPSPDVNNKADLFIAKFHAVLKLEKLNSIREKQQQQQQQQEEEETMMIGSLFDDDLI